MSPQEAIKEYLDNRFLTDEVLKARFEEKQLTISDCYKALKDYAKKQANNSGAVCLSDDEAFNVIVHFILDGETPKVHVVDKSLKLSEEEIEAAKAKALEQIKEEEIRKIKEKEKKAREKEKEKKEQRGQLSLFDIEL